jgi:nucleotide-binding universal stress UspA family protein
MKKILVPTDFSPNAEKAIQYAVELAKRSNATLYLLHSCDDLMDPVAPGQERITSEYNDSLIRKAQQQLEELRQAIEDTENLLVNPLIYFGSVREAVQKATDEHGIDLVIMGTLGKNGILGKLLGSKTASVMTHCRRPVLSIPLEYDWSTPGKMLVSVRDFEEASQFLEPVFELAEFFNAEIELAVFTDEDVNTATGFLQHSRTLHYWEEHFRHQYPLVPLRSVHLSGHHYDEAVLNHVEKEKIDLLAMVTHPRNWIDNIFNKSVTKKMGYQAKIPVLAIPAIAPAVNH